MPLALTGQSTYAEGNAFALERYIFNLMACGLGAFDNSLAKASELLFALKLVEMTTIFFDILSPSFHVTFFLVLSV